MSEQWEYPEPVVLSGGVRFHEQVQHLLLPIESVTRHPDNPREGDVDAITESIEVNGFISPVIVQKSTGRIIAGNHRYDALMSLGSDVIPVIQVDVDDTAALRFLLADNRTSDLGRYNDQALIDALLVLQDGDLGLLGTGYDQQALEALLVDVDVSAEASRFPSSTITLMLVYGEERYRKVLIALRSYMSDHDLDTESDAVAHLLGVTT